MSRALPLLALAFVPWIAVADQSLPAPVGGKGVVRAVFAVDGTIAVPLACFDGKKIVDRFECLKIVPPDAAVWVAGAGMAHLRGRGSIGCGEAEVDPIPAFVVDARATLALALWHPVQLVRAGGVYSFDLDEDGTMESFSVEGGRAWLRRGESQIAAWGCAPPTRRPSPGGTSGAAGRARGSSARARPPSPR
jgi:hypothetical protein